MNSMKHPFANTWLTYSRTEDGHCEVYDDLHGYAYTMKMQYAKLLYNLDGRTDPNKANSNLSSEEVDTCMEYFEDESLLRHSRMLYTNSFRELYYTAWIPHRRKRFVKAAKIMNYLLLLLFIPMLAAGVLLFNKQTRLYDDYMAIGIIIGLVAGVILHELAHALAALAANAKVCELGLMLYYFIPGAYVMIETHTVKSKWKRIQIRAAGIEMNVLLAALCLVMTPIFPRINGALFMAAIDNLLLVALNLTLIDGLDGTSIISELLGCDDIVDHAKSVVFGREKRHLLMMRGPSGMLEVYCCFGVMVSQIALPLIILLNVVEVLGWIM